MAAGGTEFHYIPCLNDDPTWMAALTAIVDRQLQGWDTQTAPDAMQLARQRERALAMGAKD